MAKKTNTTKNQDIALGQGVDLRADAIRFGLCDGTHSELIQDTSGSTNFPTTLALGHNGVEAANNASKSRESIDVLPRFNHRTESQQERDRARFRHELQTVLRTSKESFSNDNPRLEITENINWNEKIAQTRPIVTVPGAYDEQDREDVATAFRGVGWDPMAIVRAPLATAAAHFPSISNPEVLAVVDIGAHWCEIALIRVDPATVEYEVLSRASLPNHGQEAMSKAVAEWALDETAAELNQEIQYTPASLERLEKAAANALYELETDDQTTISVPDLTQVDLEIGTPPIEVEQILDRGECNEVLDDLLSRIITECKQVVANADIDRDDITGLLLSGRGSHPHPVRSTIGGYFQHAAQRPVMGDTRSAPALGAALLATQAENGEPPIVDTTLSREMGVLIQTNEGEKFESVIPAHAANGSQHTVELKTTEDDQTHGKLTLATRHPIVGGWETLSRYRVSGLPPKPAGDVTVQLELSAADDRVDEISATLASGGSEDRPSQVDVFQIGDEEPSGPWFTGSDESISDLDLPDELDESSRIELTVPDEQQYDENPMLAVRSIMQVRYNIWKTIDERASMSPSSLESLLKQFDGSLKRINVTPIDPKPGTEQDLLQHKKVETDTSTEYSEGTVIDVRAPGYMVDDKVKEPAEVILSEGEPESNADSSETAEESDAASDAESAAESIDCSQNEQREKKEETSTAEPEKADEPDEDSADSQSTGDSADSQSEESQAIQDDSKDTRAASLENLASDTEEDESNK